jgi:putative flavoprotein involved in K+ transport
VSVYFLAYVGYLRESEKVLINEGIRMSSKVETVVIGGGQAGLAISYYLKQKGSEHIVLESAALPGNAWRNGRWDSFTLVTPNWSVLMPGAEYQGDALDSFMGRDEVVRYLENYVENFQLPVKFNITVSGVERDSGSGKYLVRTIDDVYEADNVIVATGLFQNPRLPNFSSDFGQQIDQMHSSQYRNPELLSPGAVLVVGSGQSGCQITEGLYLSGRKVFLCVGSAGRVPRRYRGKDINEWLEMTGFGDRTVDKLPDPSAKFAPNPHVSGVGGGRSLNLHQFARDGVTLLGRLQGVQGDAIELAPDLGENLAKVDKFEAELLKMLDGYIDENKIDAPESDLSQLRDGFKVDLVAELDLRAAGITTIIWATGYTFDFSMVKLPVFDKDGFPIQNRGETDYPGLFFLGLPWLHKSKSGLFSGVGDDAQHIASVIFP